MSADFTYLSLATGHGNVHEAAGVLEALHGAALGLLLLLLRLDLMWRLDQRVLVLFFMTFIQQWLPLQ